MKKRTFLLFMGMLLMLMVLIPAVKVSSAATDADTYEPDDTYDQASVIVLNDPDVQSHSFHHAGDQDWVKFYALSGETYSIEAINVTQDADVVIALYDTDGTTLLDTRDDGWGGDGELLEFTSQSDGVYYVMVRNYDGSGVADNLAYELRVYKPIGNFPGFITGTVYDSSNGSPILDAFISTDLGGSAISIEGGNYFVEVASGTYAIMCSREGYQDYAHGGIRVSGDMVEWDIPMISTGTQTCTNSLSSSSQSFGPSGGAGTVSVIAPEGCSWAAVSNDGWITIDSGSSGNGQATVSYTVAINTETSPRTGTITIAGETCTVAQSATVGAGGVSVPTGFSASASGDILTLSWNAASGAEGYNLYYGYSSGNYAGLVNLGNTTGTSFSGIADGTYYLAVTAYSGTVESDYSDEESVTFSTIMDLSVPTGFTVSSSGSTLTLSWNAVSGAEGYNLYYGYSSGEYMGPVDLGNLVSMTFENIPDGTYYFAVTAYSGPDESGYSSEASVTFSSTVNLSAPTGFTASASDSTLILSWDAVSGADGYNLYYGFSSGDYVGQVDLGNTIGQSFSDIPDGTYYLAVTSYAGLDESGYSNEASVIVE